MQQWQYKYLISERFKTGLWYAVEEDEKKIEATLMFDYLNRLGLEGWELVTVIPVGETALMHDQLLKHILKKELR